MFEVVDSKSQNAIIKVIGVGGCGGNAIDHMINKNLTGVEFICANTDMQALKKSRASHILQIGQAMTKGLGAGAKPEIGKQAAIEDKEKIINSIKGADMLFIEAPRSVEELAAIPREVPGIHICNMVIGGKTPLLTREELGRMGYAIVAYANAALQASMLGMQQVLQHLNDKGSIVGAEEKIMMFAERQHLLGADFYRDLANQYGTRPQ